MPEGNDLFAVDAVKLREPRIVVEIRGIAVEWPSYFPRTYEVSVVSAQELIGIDARNFGHVVQGVGDCLINYGDAFGMYAFISSSWQRIWMQQSR
jgi:hypothetical protein